MAKKPYLECGWVATAHGVRGALQTECYCDTPAVLAALKTVYTLEKDGTYLPHRVLHASPHGQAVLITLEGVADREAALHWRGKMLYAARADIPVPENGALIVDMLDLPVIDADSGRRYGTLSAVLSSPAADLYDVLTPEGKHVLLPAVPAFLDRIDTEAGVFVRPIPGFFDEV